MELIKLIQHFRIRKSKKHIRVTVYSHATRRHASASPIILRIVLPTETSSHLTVKAKSRQTQKSSNQTYPRVKRSLSKVHSFVSIVSTWAVITALVLFAFGRFFTGDINDNDLIMKGIRDQLPDNLTISNVYMHDIHGFGNDTMFVLANDYDGNDITNQLIIFDKIENQILNQIYNLFGYGSNYKLSYAFSLVSSSKDLNFGYAELNILDLVDLTGDFSKEIIVQFMSLPAGTSGYYQIGIFSYSFDLKKYYLLGTFPPKNLDISKSGYLQEKVVTVFKDYDEVSYQTNSYDTSNTFLLEYGTSDDYYFFVESFETHLIYAERIWEGARFDPHRYTISIFTPNYNSETGELTWWAIFSKETDEYTEYCSTEFVKDFLVRNGVTWLFTD